MSIKNIRLKGLLPDLVAVLLFAVIALVYFAPADFEGRILYQHDTAAGRGAGQEQVEYHQRTGERTRWTNSTFSGMPTYQTAPSYDSTDTLQTAIKAYHLWLPENVWYVFVYLLGFYILIRNLPQSFQGKKGVAGSDSSGGGWTGALVAFLGAVAWAFSSYFFIIIAAGHIWKVWALAYLPPMIAGIILCYYGRYLWGFILASVFTAFEINANHVQMTYYFLFVVLALVIAFFVEAIREKQLTRFWKASAVCIAAALVGLSINLSNLYHTWQYSKESMRSKSELVKPNAENQTNSGLDRDYITQWSYGIDETWTLLIPNAKGGSHNIHLSENAKAMQQADAQTAQFLGQWYQYWGDQPFTAGPVYVGAFVLMLFFLGLFLVRGPVKWALLAVTILSVLLSWGKNYMWLTNIFIDYIPMYAKFRTPSSILVVAEFTIPLLAVMGLWRWMATTPPNGEKTEKDALPTRALSVAFVLTGGFCLLFALFPSFYASSFVSESDKMMLAQYVPQEYMAQILNSLSDMRRVVFTQDCWRSFGIIVIGTVLLLLYRFRKLSAHITLVGIIVLCLVDMWMVNKRYLNDSMFVEKSVREQPQVMTETDKQILEDKSLDYRVLNLASNTFNENETSFYHKSIGGYHAAKLRRYQELIDAYIAPQMRTISNAIVNAQGDMSSIKAPETFDVINMLNAKYVILPLQGGQTMPVENPFAFGNSWFVDTVTFVDNANEELDALGTTDLRTAAVADKKFTAVLGEASTDSTRTVTLTAYEPNELKYDVECQQDGIVVFSEIYYPGWTATIDGHLAELGRVNYVLRALRIPAGKHEVVLSFKPASVKNTERIAFGALFLLIIAIVTGLAISTRKK